MPKEAWGRAADAAADMSESETYLWDSVCSAGVSFCFQKNIGGFGYGTVKKVKHDINVITEKQ